MSIWIGCGIPTRTRTSSYALGGHCFIQLSDEDMVCCEGWFTFWFTGNFTKMYITRRNSTYYRRRIPLAIVSLCDSKYIYRPLSSDSVLAKQLAVRYNNIFNMIDIGLKLGHDVSNLTSNPLKVNPPPLCFCVEKRILFCSGHRVSCVVSAFYAVINHSHPRG